jgi:hypothetical protein
LVDYRAEMVLPFQGLLSALFVAALFHGRVVRITRVLRCRSSQFLGRIRARSHFSTYRFKYLIQSSDAAMATPAA